MKHFEVFYFFMTFSIGILSLGITVNTYIKTREKLLQYYLFFYMAFSLVVITNLLETYVDANTILLPLFIDLAIDFIEFLLGRHVLLITLSVLTHYAFSVPHAKRKSFIVSGVFLTTFVGLHVFLFTTSDFMARLGLWLNNIVFLLGMTYNIVSGIYYYQRLQDAASKKLASKFLTSFAFAVPGVINDVLLDEISPFKVYPAFYCGFSIIFSHHFVTYYRHHTQKAVNTVFGDALFEQHNISLRERDIVLLILQGYSNAKIGETLFISIHTVKTHLRNIYPKFGVISRYELIALFKNAQFSSDSDSNA